MHVLAALFAAGAGCANGSIDLVVNLETDLRPGVELTSVRTELSATPVEDAAASTIRGTMREALAGADFVRGQRVAEYADVAAGVAFVRVSLLDAAGHTVIARTTRITITGDYTLTVLVTRDCRTLEPPLRGPRITAA